MSLSFLFRGWPGLLLVGGRSGGGISHAVAQTGLLLGTATTTKSIHCTRRRLQLFNGDIVAARHAATGIAMCTRTLDVAFQSTDRLQNCGIAAFAHPKLGLLHELLQY
jgi:hypothetical protein